MRVLCCLWDQTIGRSMLKAPLSRSGLLVSRFFGMATVCGDIGQTETEPRQKLLPKR